MAGDESPQIPPLGLLASLTSASSARAWQSAPHPHLPIIATATSDKSVSIYSLRDFRLVNTISGGHKRSIRSVAWRDDGKKGESVLATGSFDASVGIWKPETAQSKVELASFRNDADEDLDLTSEGFVGSESIRAKDSEEWQFAVLLTGHDSEVKCVGFSPSNPALLATCSRDKSLWIWEAVTEEDDYETIAVLTEHSGDVKCLAWHPERETFASGSYDDTIRFWRDIEDEGDWGCIGCIQGHEGTVWSVAWEPRLKEDTTTELRLASCSDDMTVRIWKKVEPEKRESRKPGALPSIIRPPSSMEVWQQDAILPRLHSRSIYAIAWSARTGLIASCGGDGNIVVYREVVQHREGLAESSMETDTQDHGTTWQVIAQIEEAHGEYEINHVCWARRQDRDQHQEDEEIILSSGDDGVSSPVLPPELVVLTHLNLAEHFENVELMILRRHLWMKLRKRVLVMASKRAASPISPPPLKRKVVTSATNATVASFFKPLSQKEHEPSMWKIFNRSLIVGKYQTEENTHRARLGTSVPEKFAIFDLDDTIICAATGNKWERSASTWKWCHDAVPAKLAELDTAGFRIVVFSNQSTISLKENSKLPQKDSLSLSKFKSQLSAILQKLGLPIVVYAATSDDLYRKPRIGMWQQMLEDCEVSGPHMVDLASTFYVGDAAGRPKTSLRSKDHACSDRDLAANIGIEFHTPQEFFDGAKREEFTRDFEPLKYLKSPDPNAAVQNDDGYERANALDVVLFCGSPGAGKSTYFWKTLEPLGYKRVNQDTLKTRERCLKAARGHLSAGGSVAVDNTNANVETRSYWIELARSYSVPIRCVHFTASTMLCQHNDTVRAMEPSLMNPENRSRLPPVAFRSFNNRYTMPTIAEGFQDITKIDFRFHGTVEQRDAWSKYWVSKFST